MSFIPTHQLKDVLSNYSDVYHLEIKSSSDDKNTFYNLNQIEKDGISKDEYKTIVDSFDTGSLNGFKIFKDEMISFLILKYENIQKGVTLTISLSTEELDRILMSFSQYKSNIYNLDGSLFYSKDENTTSYITDINKSKLDEATIDVDSENPRILSFKIDSKYNLIFTTEILKSEAYKVNDYLIGKSKVFGLVILSLSIFIALLFSRSLTQSLEKLYNFTLSISKGEFNQNVEIKSRDEIGALGDSINFMSKEIVRYMSEMKEKARLENEIETARYVQSTYFPEELIESHNHSIASFYKPASECGGDWWGFIENEDRLCIVITDATGHGVPAALLTATAHCCIENLKQVGGDDLKSPAKILEFMNSSIQCLDGKMLMTAFCCVLDKESGRAFYSNASHNPPLYRGVIYDETKKNNFKPLLGKTGPRLGHKEFGNYVDESIPLNEIERILFFTDGILESKNSENKEYGQRRFLKSLNKYGMRNNKGFIDSIVEESFLFYGDCPIDDDVTLLSVSMKNSGELKMVDLNNKEIEKKIKENISFSSDIFIRDTPINKDGSFYLSSKSDQENIEILMNNPKINHLVGANSANIVEELLLNINNYKRNMSLGEYLDEYRFHTTNVHSKEDFDKINNLLGTLDVDGYFESPIDYLKIISNELLTNAIYHSGEGDVFTERSSMQRKSTPVLTDLESVDYTLAVGHENIAICVTDFTGKLSRDIIIENLERSFREREHQSKNGGAGLGLFLAFSYANQLIVRTTPGKCTEVICIIEKNKRFKMYKERITSFHYFEEKDVV
ncbi:SpoIIE family protein phosphatase [Halobacteriovorax sp.]|uniref:SpoIIE family protein phosphatase n=1 Tax=Halobacteriovorax sp. TaxID=2020862 RepID=UPI00356739CB